jgi:hypothetical protein
MSRKSDALKKSETMQTPLTPFSRLFIYPPEHQKELHLTTGILQKHNRL